MQKYHIKEFIKSVTSSVQRRYLKLAGRYLRYLSIYLRFFVFWSHQPRTKFIIFAQGRSGSTLLIDLLNSHPAIHCDDEILNVKVYHKFRFIKLYIKARSMITKLNKKSVYGFHVKIYQLTDDHAIFDPGRFLKKLYADGWIILYLKRNNVIRQAVSTEVAFKRGVFHLTKEEGKNKLGKVGVDCETILRLTKKRKDLLSEEQKALEGIPHMTIEYERDLLRQVSHQRTADMIFQYLGLSSITVDTSLFRTSTDNLADLIENYRLELFTENIEFAITSDKTNKYNVAIGYGIKFLYLRISSRLYRVMISSSNNIHWCFSFQATITMMFISENWGSSL